MTEKAWPLFFLEFLKILEKHFKTVAHAEVFSTLTPKLAKTKNLKKWPVQEISSFRPAALSHQEKSIELQYKDT